MRPKLNSCLAIQVFRCRQAFSLGKTVGVRQNSYFHYCNFFYLQNLSSIDSTSVTVSLMIKPVMNNISSAWKHNYEQYNSSVLTPARIQIRHFSAATAFNNISSTLTAMKIVKSTKLLDFINHNTLAADTAIINKVKSYASFGHLHNVTHNDWQTKVLQENNVLNNTVNTHFANKRSYVENKVMNNIEFQLRNLLSSNNSVYLKKWNLPSPHIVKRLHEPTIFYASMLSCMPRVANTILTTNSLNTLNNKINLTNRIDSYEDANFFIPPISVAAPLSKQLTLLTYRYNTNVALDNKVNSNTLLHTNKQHLIYKNDELNYFLNEKNLETLTFAVQEKLTKDEKYNQALQADKPPTPDKLTSSALSLQHIPKHDLNFLAVSVQKLIERNLQHDIERRGIQAC